MPEVKRRADGAHAEGKPFIVYFNMMLAENSPGFAEHRDELLVPPGQMWYKRAYEPGKDVPCWVCCPRGPYGDLLLDGMAKLAEEGGLDGVYMDGTAYPWDCKNPSHGPCTEGAVAWDDEPLTPLIATRNFLKRIRGIFDARGKPMMVAHNGGAINIETLSLCDGFYEGEQLSRYRPGYRLPLHKAAVGYCGRPWGFRTDLIPHSYGGRRMMTLAALHDTEVGGGCGELEALIYGDFQGDDVDYRPYWRPQRHVRVRRGDVVCSYYLKPDAAMLVVSNLTWDDQETALDVNRLFPDTALEWAMDVEAGKPLDIRDGRVALQIPRHGFVALRIEPGLPRPEYAPPVVVEAGERPTIGEYAANQWSINTDGSGVSCEPDVDLGDGRRGPRLKSTIYADYAQATLTARTIGRTGTIRLRLQPSGRVEALLGPVRIGSDGGRWWVQGSDRWSEGRTYAPKVEAGASEELVLALSDGVLDAAYGGHPVARGVALAGLTGDDALIVRTWGGDTLAFDVEEISDRRLRLFEGGVEHPVR